MILRLYIALHDLGGDHHGQIRNLILEFLVRLDALLLDDALGLLDHSGCLLRGLAQDLIAALCGTAGSGADDLGSLLLRLGQTLGVFAAHLLGLPMGYVRSSSKDHGRQNRIEGKLVPGQKVVVVEDLISTGGSVLDAVDALREAGAEVLGVVSIFTYGMKKGVERLAAAQVRNVSLTDLDTVASTGAQEGYITEADVARLLAFRENPSDESWIQAESQA